MARRQSVQDEELTLLRGGPVFRAHDLGDEPLLEFRHHDDEGDDDRQAGARLHTITRPAKRQDRAEDGDKPRRALFGGRRDADDEDEETWGPATQGRGTGDRAHQPRRAAYRPHHLAPMQDIHFEIDHLESIQAGHVPRGTPRYRTDLRTRERTVYETPRGRVTAADDAYGPGTSRILYTQGATVDSKRPFRSEVVDAIIAGVAIEEERVVREEITELVPRSQAPKAETKKRQTGKKGKPGKSKPKKRGRGRAKAERSDPAAVVAKSPPAAEVAPQAALHEAATTSSEGWEPSDAPAKPAARKAPAGTSPKPAAKRAYQRKTELYYDFAGDIHPVADFGGIAAKHRKALAGIGITDSVGLCHDTAASIGRRIGVPAKTVHVWKATAELAKVNGIGPQYAETLAKAGVAGIQELKDKEAEALAKKVQKYVEGLASPPAGPPITAKRIATWKEAAGPLRRVRQKAPEAAA